jgi:hypothetical protein
MERRGAYLLLTHWPIAHASSHDLMLTGSSNNHDSPSFGYPSFIRDEREYK